MSVGAPVVAGGHSLPAIVSGNSASNPAQRPVQCGLTAPPASICRKAPISATRRANSAARSLTYPVRPAGRHVVLQISARCSGELPAPWSCLALCQSVRHRDRLALPADDAVTVGMALPHAVHGGAQCAAPWPWRDDPPLEGHELVDCGMAEESGSGGARHLHPSRSPCRLFGNRGPPSRPFGYVPVVDDPGQAQSPRPNASAIPRMEI